MESQIELPLLPDSRLKTLEEKFHRYVDKTGPCWIWTKSRNSKKYGQICIGSGKSMQAHRYSYELYKGPIPKGYVICHTCDNPLCANPDHLFAGTHMDNIRDMVSKGRQCMGSRNATSKLTEEDIGPIWELITSGMGSEKIAKLYGVTSTAIRAIKHHKGWTHVKCDLGETPQTKEQINEMVDRLVAGRRGETTDVPNYCEDRNLLGLILTRAKELNVLDKMVGALMPKDGDAERAIYTTMNLSMASYCEVFLKATGIWNEGGQNG
jgi:predicted transcriptional regulator